MGDRKWIYTGLGLFLAVALLPIWRAVASDTDRTPPVLELPDSAACVEDTAFMIPNHPALLNEWRTRVVRNGEKEYTASDGKTYTMSLTGTCMGCHENRGTFCQRCHDYADVQPTCWNCHVEP